MKKRKAELTYQERALKMGAKAQKKLLAGISNDWAFVENAVKEAKQLEISAINRMRSIGLKLQEASGYEQADFDFWRSHEKQLPKTLHFGAVKACIHMARKLKEPVKTMDEARAVQRSLFEALGEAKAPRRLEAQHAHQSNPVSDFVSWTSAFDGLFSKIDESPMNEWPREKLDTFVRNTKPIVEKHEAAVKLMAA